MFFSIDRQKVELWFWPFLDFECYSSAFKYRSVNERPENLRQVFIWILLISNFFGEQNIDPKK